jgi:hypothetical protein
MVRFVRAKVDERQYTVVDIVIFVIGAGVKGGTQEGKRKEKVPYFPKTQRPKRNKTQIRQ